MQTEPNTHDIINSTNTLINHQNQSPVRSRISPTLKLHLEFQLISINYLFLSAHDFVHVPVTTEVPTSEPFSPLRRQICKRVGGKLWGVYEYYWMRISEAP